jgi:cellobiose-specific phosphotransferase system component IIC
MSRSSAALRLSSAASKLRELSDQPFIAATRDALPQSFVALLVAFLCFLPFVPVEGALFGPKLGLRVASALLPAFGIMGLALAPALGAAYAKRVHRSVPLAMVACLLAYAIALPPPSGELFAYLRLVGPSGLFLALAIGGLYAFIETFSKRNWVAALAVVGAAIAMRAMHISLTVYIEAALHPLATLGDTYFALVAIVLIETLLWAIGIHGPALLAAIVTPVYLGLQIENSSAFAAHTPLPHIVVVSLFLFVFPGGAGASLPLAALLAISRIPKLRTIGRVTVIPGFFNINEPLLFGAPIVFNPYLIPPFVIAPLVLATTTYYATLWNWVARPAFYVPSSIPTFISTYIATLDWRAVLLAAFNIAIAAIIYFPFVRAYERHLESFDKLRMTI